MEKERILFIVNPHSGIGNKSRVAGMVERHLDHDRYDAELRYTERIAHGATIAADAVKEGFETVVAVGGDGSVNDVANGIKGTDVKMGIIACGSGNGLAQHLGLPIRHFPKAIDVINSGKVVKIDSVESNRRNFVSNAGTGADANVARRFGHQHLRGFFSYVWAIIRQLLFEYKPSKVEFEIDDEQFNEKVYTLGIFNSMYYGYGVGPFKSTSLRDGYLDVLLMAPVKWFRLPWVAFQLLRKNALKLKEVRYFKAEHVLIKNARKLGIQFDGDAEMISGDLDMRIEPKNLNVIIKKDTNIDEL